MRKMTILLFIEWLLCMVTYLLGDYTFDKVCILTIITIILVLWVSIKADKGHFTLTSSLLVYTVATQFGLVIPYFFFGRDILSQYHDYTLSFLENGTLPKAVLLGNIAVITFVFMKLYSKNKYRKKRIIKCNQKVNDESKVYMAGIVMLLIVGFYFMFHILLGGTRLISTYEAFMNSSAYKSPLYSYILIFFYSGSIYLASSGTIKEHKSGWILWIILVLIFALNGNKGEFMYALLAVMGLKGIQGQKLSFKILMFMSAILFLIIPTITSLRNMGIAGNLSSAQINFFDAFSEMGMQIRTSVYVLDDLDKGVYGYLYGKSYFLPIFNLITPFLNHTTATSLIRSTYKGYGFNQVIESYLNFNIIGTIIYFGIIGYFLTKWENTAKDTAKLAYIGSITCILINATRNYFAFVPGQICVITVIYILVKKVRIKFRNKIL